LIELKIVTPSNPAVKKKSVSPMLKTHHQGAMISTAIKEPSHHTGWQGIPVLDFFIIPNK
jgi:hypothetical protein